MTRYLLDSNAVIALLEDPESGVSRRAEAKDPQDLALSSVVTHELYYGAFKSARQKANVERLDRLPLEVLAFDRTDSRHAGEIRAFLAKRGLPIGAYDVLIAGQARARALTLVTHNIAEFRRVPGLRVEDWQPK